MSQDLNETRDTAMQVSRGSVFRAEGMANAKALKYERALAYLRNSKETSVAL